MTSTGICKKWLSEKGFGFIEPNDGGEDLFVHQSELNCEGFRCLVEGDEVEYDVIEERGRKKAVSVTGPGGRPLKGDAEGWKGGGGGKGGGKGKGGGGDGCFKCGSSDHWSRECPDGDDSYGGGKGKGKGGKDGGKGKGGDGCFKCGSSDHWSRECPDGDSYGGGGKGGGGGRYDDDRSRGSDRYAPY